MKSLESVLFIAVVFLYDRGHAQLNTSCNGEMDLLLILDASSNLSPTNFQDVLNYAASFVDLLPIGPNSVQVAEIKFSNALEYTDTIINFQDYSADKAGLEARILRTRYVGLTANLADAIMTADIAIFQPTTYGARNNVSRVAVVIAAGSASNDPNLAMYANAAAASGIQIIPVGITNNVNSTQLESISYNGNYIAVSNFSELGVSTSYQILAHVSPLECFGITYSQTATTTASQSESVATMTTTPTTTSSYPTIFTPVTMANTLVTPLSSSTTTELPVTTTVTMPLPTTTTTTTTTTATTTVATNPLPTTTPPATTKPVLSTTITTTTKPSTTTTTTTTTTPFPTTTPMITSIIETSTTMASPTIFPSPTSSTTTRNPSTTTTSTELQSTSQTTTTEHQHLIAASESNSGGMEKLWNVYAPIWILILVLLGSTILLLLVALIVLACQLHQRNTRDKLTGHYDITSVSSITNSKPDKSTDTLDTFDMV